MLLYIEGYILDRASDKVTKFSIFSVKRKYIRGACLNYEQNLVQMKTLYHAWALQRLI